MVVRPSFSANIWKSCLMLLACNVGSDHDNMV